MTEARSSVNARERTSITTATLVIAPRACAPSSTMVAISSGGRLSTTNQPRSSRHLAAVDRPAPERPLTTATSIPDPRMSSCALTLFLLRSRPRFHDAGLPGQRRHYGLRGTPAEAGQRRDLLDPGLLEL